MSNNAKKVLVVDDDPVNLSLLNGVLSPFCKVYPIGSGEEALEFLEMQQPELILLDVEMPGMSGTEFFEHLRDNKKFCDIPVIFLTGLYDVKAEADAFRLGAADFIRKPINDVILLRRVNMHLEYNSLRKLKQELKMLDSYYLTD